LRYKHEQKGEAGPTTYFAKTRHIGVKPLLVNAVFS
jgi:hypothetical protein